jgi:hypothetical protein
MSTPGDEIYMPPTEPQAPMPMQGGMAPTKMKISESSSGGGWGNVDQDQKSIFEDLIQRRREGVDQIQGKLASLGPRPGGAANMDLSLLAGAVDSFTDGETNFSQTYRAPTRAKEFDQNKANLEKALSEQQNSLSDDQLKYLSAMAQSEDRKLQRQLLMETAKQRGNDKGESRDMQTEKGLRNELQSNPATKNMITVSESFKKIQSAAASASAAGDLSLVYGIAKLQDPDSAVKEGEYATVEAARGVDPTLKAFIAKFKTGQRLTPEQRADFLNQARKIYAAQKSQYQQVEDQFGELADRYGVRKDRVLIGGYFRENPDSKTLSSAPAPAAVPPRVGDVVNGYEYIGGSPGAQQSWRKK